MSRLHAEFRRLYLPHALPAAPGDDPNAEPGLSDITATAALADGHGRVRALVLALARPADWSLLSPVWRGVQAELDLPAPAVAVDGSEGLQLWFSVAQPVGLLQAQAFLAGLRRRWLASLPAARLGLMPRSGDGPGALQWATAAAVLAQQEQSPGCWPAFIAPDLAAVFADTPWLDLPPSAEGQADLLAGLRSIKPETWQAALEALGAHSELPGADHAAAGDARAAEAGAGAAQPVLQPAASTMPGASDPPAAPPTAPTVPLSPAQAAAEQFLLSVMNDGDTPLALRIQAAQALLGERRAA